MTIDSHEDKIQDAQPDNAESGAQAPGSMIARRWLRRAMQIAHRPLPGQCARRFARAQDRRHPSAGSRLTLARQVRERLRAARPDLPASFRGWQKIPEIRPVTQIERYTREEQPLSGRGYSTVPSQSPTASGKYPAPEPVHAASRETRRTGRTGAASGPAEAAILPGPLPAGVTHSLPLPLDDQARQFLAGVLDFRIPAVKIHINQAADQVARQFGADAVAWGDRLLFRSARYEPATARGLALLGHELTHISRVRSADPSGFGGSQADAHEETLALANEQRILDHLTILPHRPPVRQQPAGGMPGGSPAFQASQAEPSAVHAAAIDRPISGDAGGTQFAEQLSAKHLQQIKDAFKMWCKVDHERGA